ncbi:hypothetical protein JCM6882_002484 [Rhodosporidiobolus microsporus]
MNSLISSFRSAVRVQPARSYSPAFTAYRAYSATPSPASSSSASPSDPSSPPSSSSEGQAALDAILREVKANKPTPRPNRNTVVGSYAHKGPAHAAAFGSILDPSPARSSRSSPLSSAHAGDVQTPDQIWRSQQPAWYSQPETTTSARSFAVMNRDVAQAYRKLNRVLQENNVRRELKRQERFESPSNKRVRLNSERHRRRFKVAVGKAVALAMRMKDL